MSAINTMGWPFTAVIDWPAFSPARAAGVPGEVLANYETLRSVPGQIGIARLVGSTCHGCHLELAAVEIDRLKKLPDDELVHCEECGCILVR